MCGIAVAVGIEDAERVVAELLVGVRHRGEISDPIVSPVAGVAMGTRRLPIVDGSYATQPQASFDGGLLVSFNGEIYNHRALREELEGLGVRFETHSDTEVLANALRIWGADALQRLVGMYAFVALEVDTGEFMAARDPFGVKPLYVIAVGRGRVFCSEIKPLLRTIETGDVMLIPPGHILMRRTFGAFRSPVSTGSGSQRTGSVNELDSLLSAAVSTRVDTELPIACLFSGGIDSTLVAHYARQQRPEMPGYFLGDERAPDYSFACDYASITGFDLRLTPFNLGADNGHDLMRRVVSSIETFEPEVVRSSACSYLLCERVHKDGFRVALCGEGADELFAGYVHLESAFVEDDSLGRGLREQCLSVMHKTNLQRVDRCGMAFTIEVREPFLDPSVASYALELPGSALVDRTSRHPLGKLPLRQIYDLYPGQLPTRIRNRQKTPFNEGAGFDASHRESPWITLAEEAISEHQFGDGQRAYADYDIRTKEEFMYLEILAEAIDVSRVPHLRARDRLIVPRDFAEQYMERYIV